METLEARFWRFVAPMTEGRGCWEWMGGANPRYGVISSGGRRGTNLLAHRVSYEMHRGQIPRGLVIDHLCRNPLCVNPWHLETVTQRENLLRGFGRSATNAAKQRCAAGHAYDAVDYRGARLCRACRNAKNRRLRAASKVAA